MSGSDEFDPGLPYDPPPRRRRRPSEADDAWAAADENDLADDGVEIEDLAAGYGWEDRDRYGLEAPDEAAPVDPAAPDAPTSLPRRRRASRTPPASEGDDRDFLHRQSPSYYRERARRGEFGEYYGTAQPPAPRKARPKPRTETFAWIPRNLPYWQILLIVAMSVFALLACVLACVSVWVVL